jgi:hypothetical protein
MSNLIGTDGNGNLAGARRCRLHCGWQWHDMLAGNGGNDAPLGGNGDDAIQARAGNDLEGPATRSWNAVQGRKLGRKIPSGLSRGKAPGCPLKACRRRHDARRTSSVRMEAKPERGSLPEAETRFRANYRCSRRQGDALCSSRAAAGSETRAGARVGRPARLPGARSVGGQRIGPAAEIDITES